MMDKPKIFESEYMFCEILWKYEPIKSGELVKLCSENLGWKPTTTYTVIKRLSNRGIIKNEKTVITSIVSREEAQIAEISNLVNKKFHNSFPAFITAFTKIQHLSDSDIDEIQKMIENIRKAGKNHE